MSIEFVQAVELLIDLHYLPSLEYITLLQSYDTIILEKHEYYVKQSYRNRCYINTAHGVDMLVVPLTGKHGKVPVKDVQIDYATRWQNNHWRTIESAYRKAPYFEYYGDDMKQILYKPFQFLFDLNLELLSFCLKNIGHAPSISETMAYEKIPGSLITDLRSAIDAKIPYSERPYYHPASYYQIFGNQFVPNLSLIDLLFCEGPRAGSLLKASQHPG